MTRLFAGGLTLLIGLTTLNAAPVPKEAEKEKLYFPTKEGTRLVYELKTGDTKTEITDLVTKVEVKGNVFRVTIERENGDAKRSATLFEVSAKGVFYVATNGRGEVDPEPVLAPLIKLPAKSGDTWTEDRYLAQGRAKPLWYTYTVGKEEEVEVAAGKFRAIPIKLVVTQDGRHIETNTIWCAPVVGVVKTKWKSGNDESTRELKSFTLGK
jgi:hypothetical protein